MVLIGWWRSIPLPIVLAGMLCAARTGAQEIATAAPVLDIPEDVFVNTDLSLGGVAVELGGTARTEYDSNIYAQAFGGKDDVTLIFQPYLAARKTMSTSQLYARAEGNIRHHLRYDTENADGGEVRGRADWSPTASDKLVLATGFLHGIEDRGEPEASTVRSIGPREFDSLDGDLSYSHRGARFGFLLRGTATTYDYDRAIDRARNLDSYAVVARGSYRVSPLVNGFVEGFVNRRDFAPTVGEGGLDRDSSTYGGRVGVAIDPGGTLRGEAAAGIYKFDPADARLQGRSGFSAQAGLIFQPIARTAFTIDAFTGNVATYQTGASSRADTRLRAGVQQELRHNLRWQASVAYRRSRYFGTGLTQNIYAGVFEVEYIINRRLILAGDVRYSDRNSSAPLDGFSRLRTGLTFKYHY